MRRTILSVAYPLAPTGPDVAGGAEQILSQIDRAITRAGWRSLVIAREDSKVSGTLVPIPRASGALTAGAIAQAQEWCRRKIARALERWPVDLIHMHGMDFDSYLPPAGIPVLVTLHVPWSWYSASLGLVKRPGTYLHCVSHAQHADAPPDLPLLPEIPNGVAEQMAPGVRKRNFALALGRMAPEKGFHLALEAATRARTPMLLGGQVFDFPEHRRYYRERILPRIDGRTRRYVGLLRGRRKRRLLTAARCVLIPSVEPETFSLVAAEALSAGTPVIAFRSGALVDAIEEGITGYLVDDVEEMAEAIGRVDRIDPDACRQAARRFCVERMTKRYLETYQHLIEMVRPPSHAEG
jgi:glycosyltransferase involved in cell wall biosynthesis